MNFARVSRDVGSVSWSRPFTSRHTSPNPSPAILVCASVVLVTDSVRTCHPPVYPHMTSHHATAHYGAPSFPRAGRTPRGTVRGPGAGRRGRHPQTPSRSTPRSDARQATRTCSGASPAPPAARRCTPSRSPAGPRPVVCQWRL